MSETLLFSIGVGVFAMTVVAAMVIGRQVFSRLYDAQVADAKAFALRSAAASAVVTAGVDSAP